MIFFSQGVSAPFSLSRRFTDFISENLMLDSSEVLPVEVDHGAADVVMRPNRLRNSKLYFSRPDFKSLVDLYVVTIVCISHILGLRVYQHYV